MYIDPVPLLFTLKRQRRISNAVKQLSRTIRWSYFSKIIKQLLAVTCFLKKKRFIADVELDPRFVCDMANVCLGSSQTAFSELFCKNRTTLGKYSIIDVWQEP